MDIAPYLRLLAEKNGSDLFFTAGAPVKLKIEGSLVSVGKTALTAELVQAAADALMDDRQREAFAATNEADFAISLEGVDARFRVNVFKQRAQVALVLRLVPTRIPTIEQLDLPAILGEFVMHKRGLILMAGATGSGKSTTLAAMLQHRNANHASHILTIEDPIEFYHPNLKSIVNQREVGVDTESYARALKACMREAPDVILIGEVRDRPTMKTALELSNTGHLTLCTLHANNASQALERVVNMFAPETHAELFMDLALNLRCIVSQRLLPDLHGKRCVAVEILVNTPHMAELILKGEIGSVKDAMQESGARGMQTFDDALFKLYKDGRIELEEALGNADSRTNLEARINFG